VVWLVVAVVVQLEPNFRVKLAGDAAKNPGKVPPTFSVKKF